MENKIIEVNGVKMELDARTAKVQEIQKFKIGDSVLLLIQEDYGQKKTKALPGIIVEFANFINNPTIVVAYITDDYSPQIKRAYINKESVDLHIVHADPLGFNMADVSRKLLRKVEDAEAALIQAKRDMELFNKVFEIRGDLLCQNKIKL